MNTTHSRRAARLLGSLSTFLWVIYAAASYAQSYPGYGAAPPGQRTVQAQSLDELMGWERQDMGVAPPRALHAGPMHGATPSQIPGGQVITTKGLVALLQQQQVRPLVFDVLGAPQQLPHAIPAVPAAQPGDFKDNTQQEFSRFLQQMTQGNREMPLVFYCGGPQCWMSYNAALRAINLGYRNVLWYRGGLEAWQRAGLPMGGAQQAMPMQGGDPTYTGGPGGPGGQPGFPPQGGGYPQQGPQGYPPQNPGYPPPAAYPPPPGPPR